MVIDRNKTEGETISEVLSNPSGSVNSAFGVEFAYFNLRLQVAF